MFSSTHPGERDPCSKWLAYRKSQHSPLKKRDQIEIKPPDAGPKGSTGRQTEEGPSEHSDGDDHPQERSPQHQKDKLHEIAHQKAPHQSVQWSPPGATPRKTSHW